MKIVIVGSGRVGAQLASSLSLEGHDVSIVDKDPKSFHRLAKTFRGQAIKGIGFDREILLKAGIDRADAFASVTNGDNTNIVSALMARNVFRVPKVVTRIADPQRAEIYRRFGISTISPTTWGANAIREILLYPALGAVFLFGNGEVQLVQVRVGPRLAGNAISRLNFPANVHVVAIVRLGQAFIPTTGTELQPDDLVYIAADLGSMPKLEEIVHG